MKQNTYLPIKRLKTIRESLGFTIKEFTEGLAYPTYESVETGNTDLPGALVAKLMKLYSINPLWLYGDSNLRFLDTSSNTAPIYIALDETDEESILMVNEKASAGYAQNILDKEWYSELPSMRLPLANYRNASYRGFKVEGDSMTPTINPGDWVIGKSVPSIAELNFGKIYIVVLRDAVVVKQVVLANEKGNTILLHSANSEYEDIVVPVNDIQELWEVSSKLTFGVGVSKQNNLRKELQESMETLTDR